MKRNKVRDRGRGSEPHLLGFHFSPVPWNSPFMLLYRALGLHKTIWRHDSKLCICLPPTVLILSFILILHLPWSFSYHPSILPFLSFSSVSLTFLFGFHVLICFPLLSREEMVEGRFLGRYSEELISRRCMHAIVVVRMLSMKYNPATVLLLVLQAQSLE